MKIKELEILDVSIVMNEASPEAYKDMITFNHTIASLSYQAMESKPLALTVHTEEGPECVCWYTIKGNKAFTSMYYSRWFLNNKGITAIVKNMIDSTVELLKKQQVDTVEVHSLLSHPYSEIWYKKLGFTRTTRSYDINGKTVTVFERRL